MCMIFNRLRSIKKMECAREPIRNDDFHHFVVLLAFSNTSLLKFSVGLQTKKCLPILYC